MKLNFRLSFENYYEYNRIYSKISVGANLKAIFGAGVFMAIVGAIILSTYFAGMIIKTSSLLLGLIVFLVGLYMCLYIKVIYNNRLKREVRKKYRTSDYFNVERFVEFFDTQFSAYSENDDYRGDYENDIKEFIETENLFIIMVRGRRGIIIPKRAVDEREVSRMIRKISDDYDIGRRLMKG